MFDIYRQRLLRVRGAKLWKRIPLDMQKKDTTGASKNALKKIFFLLVLMCVMFFSFLNANVILRLYLIVFLKF